jgi:hypothetical protein
VGQAALKLYSSQIIKYDVLFFIKNNLYLNEGSLSMLLSVKRLVFFTLIIIALMFPTSAFASTGAKSGDTSYFDQFLSFIHVKKEDNYDSKIYREALEWKPISQNICLGYPPDKDDHHYDDLYRFWYSICKELLKKPICY